MSQISAGQPSRAQALGMLAALSQRTRRHTSGAADTAAPISPQILAAAAHLRQQLAASKALALRRSACARELGQQNSLRAELFPRHAKLTGQAEGLRRAQMATPIVEQVRVLRRQRAELGVQIEDLAARLAQYERQAALLRSQLLAFDQELAQLERVAFAAREALRTLQGQAPPLSSYVTTLQQDLEEASVRLFLQRDASGAAAFAASRRASAKELLALHEQMRAGRFRAEDVEVIGGGRAPVTGEVLWSLAAIGDFEGLRQLHASLAPQSYLHQIFHVYRAFLPGLYLSGHEPALAEVLRLHRYSQGLRGALAEAMWHLLDEQEHAFVRALRQVVLHDFRTRQTPSVTALGLISVTAMGLARMAQARGLQVPDDLGGAVPPSVWRGNFP